MNKSKIINESSVLIKDKAKEKFVSAKNDLQLIAFWIVEFFLTLILVGAILLYLDGRFNTIEFPFNLIIFAGIGYGVLHFYRYTESFREVRQMKHKDNFKSFVLEFIIFILIIASTYIYQDPTINIIPYPFNFIIFLILLSIPLYFYIKEKYLK